MFESAKLLIGKQISAWKDYPATRQLLQSMPSGPPVFVTGTHRSGTTWVAGMLAAPGIWYIHEPFNPDKGLWHEYFTYLCAGGENRDIDRLVKGLLHGRFRQTLALSGADHWLMPLRLLQQPVNRILIKDPIACLISEYLTCRFDFQTIVVFRHPAAFASGLRKLGWPISPAIKQFLHCHSLMQDWLNPYRNIMEAMKDREDLKSATVLHACLNTVLWGYTTRNSNMRAVSFEGLCLDPIDKFEQLYHDLALPYDDEVKKTHFGMCFTGKSDGADYRTHEVHRNSKEMAERWRSHLSETEIKDVRSVWEQFDLPLYRDQGYW